MMQAGNSVRMVLFWLAMAIPSVVEAQFYYTVNSNSTISITGYNGSGGAVTIPDEIDGLPVTSVGANAFSGSGPNSIAVGAGVTNIGNSAFSGDELTTIVVDALNPAYSSVDGLLFDKNQTTLIECPHSKAGSETIPNTVVNIGDYAFYYCEALTNVTIPDSVTNIGQFAFESCVSLTSVIIPNNVKSIGYQAFPECISLNSVTIGNNVTNIGVFAFAYCNSLTNVTIPNSVTSIGYQTFEGCSALTSITIGNGVTSIGQYAFWACSGLTNVTIGNSVTNIDADAFGNCSMLTTVKIPKSVRTIGDNAFYSCTGLTAIYFQGNAPSVGLAILSGDYNATVYYFSGMAGFEPAFSGLVGRPVVLWNPLIQVGDTSFGQQANQFGFTITGTGNLVIVIEATTTLANPVWTTLATNTLTGGSSHFIDPQWTNYPRRFYRLKSP